MPNRTAAQEWMTKAWHHYSSAVVLNNVGHYTDVIAIELHYAVEILLKSILANSNKKIIKTHDLLDLYKNINDTLTLSAQQLDLLDIVSQYHIAEAYPAPEHRNPSQGEIAEVIDFTQVLFERVCHLLEIDIQAIKAK